MKKILKKKFKFKKNYYFINVKINLKKKKILY